MGVKRSAVEIVNVLRTKLPAQTFAAVTSNSAQIVKTKTVKWMISKMMTKMFENMMKILALTQIKLMMNRGIILLSCRSLLNDAHVHFLI